MDEPDLGQLKGANAKTNLDQTIDEHHVILKSNEQERMLENENEPIKLFSPTSLREENIKILAENVTQIIISNSLQVCREKRFEKKLDSTPEKSKNHNSNTTEELQILTKNVTDVISNAYNGNNLDEINNLAVTFVENVIKNAHNNVHTDSDLEIMSAKIVEAAIQYVQNRQLPNPNLNKRFDPSIQPLPINLGQSSSSSNPPVANESSNVLTGIEKMNLHSEMEKDVNSQDKVFSTIPGGGKNQKDRNAFGCVREEMDLNKIAQQEVKKAIQQAIQTIQDQTGMISS